MTAPYWQSIRGLKELDKWIWADKKAHIRHRRSVENGTYKSLDEAKKAQELREDRRSYKFWLKYNIKEAEQAFVDGKFKTLQEAFHEQNEKERRRQASYKAREWLSQLQKDNPTEYEVLKSKNMHWGHKHVEKFVHLFKDKVWFEPRDQK